VQSYLLTVERALLIAPHQSSTRKPDILVENRDFLPNPPAFEGGGVPSEYCHNVWYGVQGVATDGEKNGRCVYSFRQNTRT